MHPLAKRKLTAVLGDHTAIGLCAEALTPEPVELVLKLLVRYKHVDDLIVAHRSGLFVQRHAIIVNAYPAFCQALSRQESNEMSVRSAHTCEPFPEAQSVRVPGVLQTNKTRFDPSTTVLDNCADD